MGTYSDVILRGVTKATGMQRVLDYVGISRENCIGVGDSVNDLPMIEFAGLGVAMGNAPEGVKAKADVVTESIDNDGVAVMIERYVLESGLTEFSGRGMDMTDFAKVRQYYRNFDEENRLTADGSGRLEFEMTLRILRKHLPERAKILDLGGAAGVYSFPLAEMGYEVYLADLSEALIDRAKAKNARGLLKACEVVNAVDLGRYEDDFFDVVLLFGPLYHLTEQSEREACLREVNRVLKAQGMVFAAFIPHLAGSIAIVDRYLRRPEQVNAENLSEVFRSGRFRNASGSGFQEGYYPTAAEIRNLFSAHGFEEIEVRSVRGFGYEKDDQIYSVGDPEMLGAMMEWIERTASEDAIVEMCGHAVYIGTKNPRTA